MKKVFYYATVGTNIEVSENKLKDFPTDFGSCSDPVTYGVWWTFNKLHAIPNVTLFCTEGTQGSVHNFNRIKNKLPSDIQIEKEFLDFSDLWYNLKKLDRYFDDKLSTIARNYDNYFIVVNPTSGTNPMTIAMFQSIMQKLHKIRDLHNVKIIYIREFKGEKKADKGTFADMSAMELDLMQVSDASLLNAAKGQIGNQNFSAAYLMLEKAASKDPTLNSIITCFRYYAEGLMLWDNFNHKEAITKLGFFIKNVQNVKHSLQPEDQTIIAFIQRKLDYLKANSVAELSVFHIADLLDNAERRFQKKENLDGTMRLYRAIELFFELRLRAHNFNVQKPNFDMFSEGDKERVNAYYKKRKQEVVSRHGNVALRDSNLFQMDRIYTKEMLALLDFFNDGLYIKLLQVISVQEIITVMELRNTSYLTHGLSSAVETDKRIKAAKSILERFKTFLAGNYESEVLEITRLGT